MTAPRLHLPQATSAMRGTSGSRLSRMGHCKSLPERGEKSKRQRPGPGEDRGQERGVHYQNEVW
eukprot:12631864-Prorocentrum_lima.AAC.1